MSERIRETKPGITTEQTRRYGPFEILTNWFEQRRKIKDIEKRALAYRHYETFHTTAFHDKDGNFFA